MVFSYSRAIAALFTIDLIAAEKAHHSLSEREMEVLQLIGAGKSLKEIAAMLSLSVKSVGTYRARVLEKMAMSTNADLIRYVIENNLAL